MLQPHVNQIRNPFEGLALRLYLYAAWFGFLALAFVFTVALYCFQGFSPDGPPPGFKPEPFGWFALKCLPLVFMSLLTRYWWFSGPLFLVTIWEMRRLPKRKKRIRDYDLDSEPN